MKTYGGVDVYIHVFLTSALLCGEWPASHPRTSLDYMQRKFLTLLGLKIQPIIIQPIASPLYKLIHTYILGGSPKLHVSVVFTPIPHSWVKRKSVNKFSGCLSLGKILAVPIVSVKIPVSLL
jgi:hypothetical protein